MSNQGRVLVVEDHEGERRALMQLLKSDGFSVFGAESADKALGYVDENIDVVMSDLHMGDVSGIDLLQLWKKRRPDTMFILLTGERAPANIVEAMKAGAYDYVTKPINPDELNLLVRRAIEAVQKDKEIDHLRRRLDQKFGLDQIIGQSKQMKDVFAKIQRAAPVDCTVLILGENGTGKELVAQALHHNSLRKKGPFVAVNVAAVPSTLVESELFGHVRGAFTDAKADRVGRFELADGGTLFLDEIANVPLAQQAKLLRVLQTGEFERVGSSRTRSVSVRLVSATNADLHKEAAEGRFREDLLFRINTVEVRLPPLRERREDIPALAAHFLHSHARRYRKHVESLDPEALRALLAHPWPGNVRELDHVIERAVLMTRADSLEPGDLGLRAPAAGAASLEQMTLDEVERVLIQKALARHGGNVSDAAKTLGLSRSALYRRLERHGL